MIFYFRVFLKAYNMLKEYVDKHEGDSELNSIVKLFSQSYGYTASGEDIIEQ